MFVEVAKAGDLPVGRARVCTIGEKRIALYHTTRGFFATGNSCPHRGGPLGEGDDILGNEIVCPWHFFSFDIVSGVCPGNEELRVPTYEVQLDGERILVNLA